MPLAAYFRNIGAILFVLLFVADYFLPKPIDVPRAQAYSPAIHIISMEKLPDRIVFDTKQMPIMASNPALPAVNVAEMPGGPLPSEPDEVTARNAFALASHASLPPPATMERNKRRYRHHHVAMRVPRYARWRPPAAPRRQFAWYGFRYW
jgi:hypothetical protein